MLSTNRIGAVVIGVALSASACSTGATSGAAASDGGGATNTTTTSGGALPCDVDAVLGAHCRTCHGNPTQFTAPMPLVTYADLHAPTPSNPSVPVYQTVGVRTHDDAKPMPQPPNARLGANDQATLDAWVQAGAPPGDGSQCSVGSGADAGTTDAASPEPDDCVFDTHIAPSAAYTMSGQEVYACYGFDIPAAGKRHVTEIKVRLDNSRIVHHALLLESPTSTSATPVACDAVTSLTAPMLYAWAPGGNPLIVPPEAGFPQDQTTHYVVQIHYNNAANLPSPSDSTGFDLCTTAKLRKYDANVIAFGTDLISIPPRGSATATSCYSIPSGLDGRTFFSAFPHMHKLGMSMATTLESDGGVTDMGAIANWNFSNQPWLSISATAHLGDVVHSTCTWNNPGSSTVGFGQTTSDEMCYSFSAYYPAASPGMGWGVPATLSVPCQ